MLCEQIMSTAVQSIRAHDTALAAAKLMRTADVGFLPVLDYDGKVIGALTDRDLVVRLGAEGSSWHTRVADLMTTDVISCRPDDDLASIEEMMCVHHTSRVVCVDDEARPVGVISLADIARHEDAYATAHTLRELVTREPQHV